MSAHFAVTLAQTLRRAYFKHIFTFRPYILSRPPGFGFTTCAKVVTKLEGKCHRNVCQKKPLVLPQLLIRLLKCCWCALLCVRGGDGVCLLNKAA